VTALVLVLRDARLRAGQGWPAQGPWVALPRAPR
jgi:hypothetical protein